MTLRRTIHRREARKRAKARKLAPRVVSPMDTLLKAIYEARVEEEVNRSTRKLDSFWLGSFR